MPRLVSRAVLLLSVISVLSGIPSGCAEKPPLDVGAVRAYADPITEDMLLAINQGDYTKFREKLDQNMIKATPQEAFTQMKDFIRARVGDYISKEFLSAEKQKGKDIRGLEVEYTIVTYKAKFSLEPADVVITISFAGAPGEEQVAGFYLNSPKLRAK